MRSGVGIFSTAAAGRARHTGAGRKCLIGWGILRWHGACYEGLQVRISTIQESAMHPVSRPIARIVRIAAFLALACASGGQARADAFAEAILSIDNFRLLHADGTPYGAADVAIFGGSDAARAAAGLNGVFAVDAQRYDARAGGTIDLLQQAAGGASLRGENNFSPLGAAAGQAGSQASADQRLIGNFLSGATSQTRAEAAIAGVGAAGASSEFGGATQFRFSLGADDYMTIAFSATPFSQATLGPGGGADAKASAALSWSVTIVDLSTGATVLSFAPDALNAWSGVSRDAGGDGTMVYDPGQMFFTATSDLLSMNDSYQLTISQTSSAAAVQNQTVPEPATLASIGAGLLAMSWLARRKRQLRP